MPSTPASPTHAPSHAHRPGRRGFIRSLALAGVAAVGGIGRAACGGGGDDPVPTVTSAHGVASGDPLADRVVLWTRPSAAGFDATADATAFAAAVASPTRQLLGAAQFQRLQDRMTRSTATWQVLGQQVLMGRMDIPAPILFEALNPGSGTSVAAHAALAGKAATAPATLTAQERAVLAQLAIPYNLDA